MAGQRGRSHAPWWLALCMGLLAGAHRPVAALETWPVAVHEGRCEVVLPTAHADDQFFLILGALGRGGPYSVEVRTAATNDPEAIELDRPNADPDWARRVKEAADRQARARRQQAGEPVYPPLPAPPEQKTFHLFVRDVDFHNASNYVAVTGRLQAVGKHCQVYVDRTHADLDHLRPTIADAVRSFDEEVYPRSLQAQGRALDVDRDGRFTILFSGWLAKLQSGKVALSGFVRGSDLYRDLSAPFSNHCDMMYLNTDLKPGGYLRTLLAHEYTHAVMFSEHVFGDYLPGAARQDEESWLNEGLAHLAEDMHGFSWANLDYRVSGFLNTPERHALVVPDYYGSGLWRTPGNRGSAFLFLRWCGERYGHGDFAARLIQSNLQGVANLEAATQRPFAELFRDWSAALAVGGVHRTSGGATRLGGLELHQRLGSRLVCGPRHAAVPLTQGRHSLRLAGTATACCLLHSPGAERSRLTVTADPAAELQVTLIRLPRQTPRLSLQCERLPGTRQVRLTVTAHGGAVQLQDAAWERLSPSGDATGDSSTQDDATAAETVRAWFGGAALRAGESRRSVPLSLPEHDDALVFRVSARDAAGHDVAGWAVVESGQK